MVLKKGQVRGEFLSPYVSLSCVFPSIKHLKDIITRSSVTAIFKYSSLQLYSPSSILSMERTSFRVSLMKLVAPSI